VIDNNKSDFFIIHQDWSRKLHIYQAASMRVRLVMA
jgi:hypothetical protein